MAGDNEAWGVMAGNEAFVTVEERQRAYRLCFGAPPSQGVLADLSHFCCAADTCVAAPRDGPVDVQRTLILEGRREVWLRIQQQLNLTPEQLFALATGRHVQLEQQDDDNAE